MSRCKAACVDHAVAVRWFFVFHPRDSFCCDEQGPQVGVLLVQLRSAALAGGELTHPAVRLTLGKQARSTYTLQREL